MYFTTDGSDPRLAGDAVSASARLYAGAFTPADNAGLLARVLAAGEWSALAELDPRGPSCLDAAECDDGDPCTIEACIAGTCAWGDSAGDCGPCMPGDCNMNGSIDVADSICAVLCLTGEQPDGADCVCAADCNCSGGSDAADPTCTLSRRVGSFAPDSCTP